MALPGAVPEPSRCHDVQKFGAHVVRTASCGTHANAGMKWFSAFGHVVGLAALDMVQPWAELDVAGVGLSFANWMAVVII